MWKENLLTLVRNHKAQLAATSITSLAIGGAAGFVVTRRLLGVAFAEVAAKEIDEAKKYYSALYKKDGFETPADAVETLISDENSELLRDAVEAMQAYSGVEIDPESETVVTGEAVVRNIFGDPTEDLDDEEIANRPDDAPYIITNEEYFVNEDNHEQTSVTYFEGDDVLSDGRDQPISDVDGIIGENNLKFGHGSQDKNIVYIRNGLLEMDFEVIRSTGKFTTEVLGLDDPDELKHSDRRPRKFRDYDD